MGHTHSTEKELNCKVVIFLENHAAEHPIQDAKTLLPFFKEKGFNTLCFETKEAKEDFYASSKEHLELTDFCMYDTSIKIEKREAECKSIKLNLQARIDLLDLIDQLDIKYCAMDTSNFNKYGKSSFKNLAIASQDKRDKAMSDEIKESCNDGNVLAIVGRDHYIGINKLLDSFAEVKGYYTPSTPIYPWTMTTETYFRNVRTSSEEIYHTDKNTNITVIDIYRDSSFVNQIPAIIEQDYLQSLSDSIGRTSDDIYHYEL